MPSRRDAIKTIGASLGAGALTGCSGTGSGMTTFEATPAWVTNVPFNPTLDIDESGNPMDVEVSAFPTGGSRIVVTEDIDPVGTVSVVNYGVHQTFIATDDTWEGAPHLILGNVGTLTSPTVDLPGIGEQNPVGEITREDVINTMGSVDLQQSVESAVYEQPMGTAEFDGLPSLEALLSVAYRGTAKTAQVTTPLERGGNGVLGKGTIDLVSQDGSIFTFNAEFFGNKQEHGGDYIITVGWLWQSDRAMEQPPAASVLERLRELTTHPESCASESCVSMLNTKATQGLMEAFTVLPRRMLSRSERVAEESQEILNLIESTKSDLPGDDRQKLREAGRDFSRIIGLTPQLQEHLTAAIDAPLRKLPGRDQETEFETRLVDAFETEQEMRNLAQRAGERVSSVESESDIIDEIREKSEDLSLTLTSAFNCCGGSTLCSQINL